MYSIQPYTGAGLPPKCLCLTYDDGPGRDTCAIAEFLNEQEIAATFFVVGKYAAEHTATLEKVALLGHLIANHTYEHPDMPYYLSRNGDVHNQILRTDAVIRKYINGNTIYFRSPYGKWSDEVANELNLNLQCAVNHIGPVHWDIGGVDCYCWKNDETVDFTVNKYLQDIREKGRGIIVMHDEIADMNFLKEKNQTLALTKKLIPLLKEEGYTFVRLDEVELLKQDAAKPYTFKLQATDGKLVALSGNDGAIQVAAKKNTIVAELTPEELGYGKIALKSSNGLYLSVQAAKGNEIAAVSSRITDAESFDLIPFSAYQVVLRANNGNYFSMETKQGGRLLAAATYMRGAELFTVVPSISNNRKHISLREKYKLLKRQVMYIQSKIRQGA